MAENALVDSDIRLGESIVRALDNAADVSMRPTAAFWFLFPEEENWRLLLALPATATDPPQAVYTRLLDVITREQPIGHAFRFDSVALLAPDSPLIDLLSGAIQTGPADIAGIRFSNNTINGQLIPDVYIYRLTRPLPEQIAAG
ncbi:MAG TPA: hypothetical protein VFM96_14415 [Gaiellaceae bacterium]|nr:hypothetical protein [Gaiellaceae bacterium]